MKRDGKIDVIYPDHPSSVFISKTPMPSSNGSFRIDVFGPNGEQNRHGRLVRIPFPTPPQRSQESSTVDRRTKAQNQYTLLVDETGADRLGSLLDTANGY